MWIVLNCLSSNILYYYRIKICVPFLTRRRCCRGVSTIVGEPKTRDFTVANEPVLGEWRPETLLWWMSPYSVSEDLGLYCFEWTRTRWVKARDFTVVNELVLGEWSPGTLLWWISPYSVSEDQGLYCGKWARIRSDRGGRSIARRSASVSQPFPRKVMYENNIFGSGSFMLRFIRRQ